jgi:ABC-type sugar transport system ATPase subunit
MTSTATQTPLVSMRGISKSFFGNEVLHGVDFTIHAGRVHGLVGHNGAGKSTLMKTLAGLSSDYTGEVELDGQAVRLASPAASLGAGIAVIHQEFALVPDFTVEANLALGRERHTRTGTVLKRQMRQEAEMLLADLGFDIPMDVPVRRLSVAHQQLTEIAKALSREARILVMDEPTARLAPAERQALFAVTRKLAARGVGIVYISHFLDEVLEICDEVTVLRDGDLVDHAPAGNYTIASLSRAIVGEEALEEAAEPLTGPAAAAADGHVVVALKEFGAQGRPASSFEVRAGEVLGLAGLVGSGRTSLVEAVCGARPHTGTLIVDGKQAQFGSPAQAADAGVVLVPEDRKHRGLVLTSSVAENITLTALAKLFTSLGFVKAAEQRRAVSEAVTRYNIRGAQGGKALARSLSGGNQQKVLIARVAEAQPRVLILDQPTAGVDIGAKAEIYRHVRSLAADGVACIVVSDELEELLTLTDRIAVVRGGQVATIVPAADLTPGSLLELMSQTQAA